MSAHSDLKLYGSESVFILVFFFFSFFFFPSKFGNMHLFITISLYLHHCSFTKHFLYNTQINFEPDATASGDAAMFHVGLQNALRFTGSNPEYL